MIETNGNSESQGIAIATEPVEIRQLNGGVQALFRFPNGYGASVVRGPFTYGGTAGLWELAVLKWTGRGDTDFELTYETEITDDVIGHLSPAEVDELLSRIRRLDSQGREPESTEAERHPDRAATLRAIIASGVGVPDDISFGRTGPILTLVFHDHDFLLAWSSYISGTARTCGGMVCHHTGEWMGWQVELYCHDKTSAVSA